MLVSTVGVVYLARPGKPHLEAAEVITDWFDPTPVVGETWIALFEEVS